MRDIRESVKNRDKPIFLRLKFTPFIPNPLTPFSKYTPDYNINIRKQIDIFFMNEKYNRANIVFINDGILDPYSYYTQVFLTRCKYEELNIGMLKNRKLLNFKSKELVKKTNTSHIKIKTFYGNSYEKN